MELKKALRPSWPMTCVGSRAIATRASMVSLFITAKVNLTIMAAIVSVLGVVLIPVVLLAKSLRTPG